MSVFKIQVLGLVAAFTDVQMELLLLGDIYLHEVHLVRLEHVGFAVVLLVAILVVRELLAMVGLFAE
jgi:hypothetical protein